MRTLTQPLNMSPGGIPPVVHVSQYDSDFTITFTLFSLFGGFTIESGTTAQIRGTKSSGTGYSADAAINISAKTVTVTGNAQMTAAAGQNIFEIVLKRNNKEISSKNFILLCERAALDADTITDESVLKELNAIIEGAETATQAAEEANDAADRAEAAAQTLVIDSTLTHSGQAADAKATGDAIAGLEDEIAQIVPGLSSEAKDALLACFEHVAWVDEHGQDYYDALESALYPEAYWDYEWDVSSGTLPTGMTASAYDFTTETDALYAENPHLALDHVGNMRIFIECKLYAFNTELQQESYRNLPQIVIANGNGKGCKLIASYNTNNPNGYVAFGVNNVNTLVDGIKGMEWHTYDINSVSGTHTLKVDNVTADIPQNTDTSQYITSTGIVSGSPEAPLVYIMCLKQFKYKIL